MSVKVICRRRQALAAVYSAALTVVLIVCSCGLKAEKTPLIPPVTSPLSQPLVGFGVVNVSYIHVNAQPAEGGTSPGYLRKGAVVRILQRRMVKNGNAVEPWVLADGNYRGWVREAEVDIYDNELRALTASSAMSH